MILFSCSTSKLQITSSPESAEVVFIGKDRSLKKIGTTPIDIDSSTHKDLFTGSSQVQVVKQGYLPQSAFLPDTGYTAIEGKIHFNLEDTVLPKVCEIQKESYNEIAKGTAEVANLIQRKRYDEAQNVVQNYLLKYNYIAVFYDFLGNIYYLKKDYPLAIESYKKSLAIIPNNIQTLKIIEKIQKQQIN